MIKSLRKRHLQAWSMLMVLLPAGIIGARWATSKAVTDQLLQPAATAALPTVIKTINTKNYTVNIRQSNDSSRQLEWINKTILSVPTCTIYILPAGTNDIKKGQLIGRIEAMGVYRFAIPANTAPIQHLLLYDFIHEQTIDTLHF